MEVSWDVPRKAKTMLPSSTTPGRILNGFLFTNMYDIHICIYICMYVKLIEKVDYQRRGRGLKTQGDGDKQG